MNRVFVLFAVPLGALMPLVFDSALKGAVLLVVAALMVLAMWRASASARHLVWLVAVVALLVVPLLSGALPQWRVLPRWAASPLVEAPPAAATEVGTGMGELEPIGGIHSLTPSTPRLWQSADSDSTAPGDAPLPSGARAPSSAVPSGEGARNWRVWIPLVWAAGFALLAMRLGIAHWLLRRATRRCSQLAAPSDDAMIAEFAAACAQLGIRRRVTVLLDAGRTMPVVWGVLRPRLLLPAEARDWSREQLRSVFLHELSHIRRRDPLVQWLTQIACALHWWNPLVWLAAWRLHVERERACDDLVLAVGVRPSAYAEHLLHVATRLAPARWTAPCGLAMARRSSLEGRLLAVLSEGLNRRHVTGALAATALLLGAVISIPIAMLRAADEEWNPPSGAHIGSNEFSTYCVHDGTDTAFVIAYQGQTASSSALDSNSTTRTWSNSGTLIAKKPGITLAFHREHTAPGKLRITTVPTEGRELSESAPVPRDFGQMDYDLAKGRVLLLTDTGLVRQLDIATPPVIDQTSAKKLAALIAKASTPERQDARALYEIWKRHARANGNIPGALVGELAAAVRQFIRYNPTWETVPQLDAILPRLDATRDWKPAAAIALLDEVAAVQDTPLTTAVWKGTRHTIRQGEALPDRYADVTWGNAPPNGPRTAWVLEPAAEEHRMGAALKARLLVHNPGQVPVMLQVPTWHQGPVKASDAKGAEVAVSGIEWTTLAQLFPCRLGPGEYIEINSPGVGLGPRAGMGPWAGPRVGSNVLANPGDELTLTHGPVPLDGSGVGVSEDDPHLAGPGWWRAHIKARLSRDLPLPADAAERTRLLDRAVRELFGTPPTPEETAAFVADQTPEALDSLVNRLGARVDVVEFSGKLEAAPARFRVLAADPAADRLPRVVLGPGEYPIADRAANGGPATLKIVGRPVGDRRTNDAQILFEALIETGKLPPEPHKLDLPDGWGTWAIVCRPGDGFFYLLHKGSVRKIDFSDPANVTETLGDDMPDAFREEAKRQLDIAGIAEAKQAEVFQSAAAPAGSPAATAAANPPADEAPLVPKHEYAQSLFRKWQARARTDGKIPGALIGQLAREVDSFLQRYPENEEAPQLAALRPRLDASRDWTREEVIALLDEITAIATAPVGWTDTPMVFSAMRFVQGGQALPVELEGAAWGPPAENGLRSAWLLEPRAEQYALGSVLKARVLFHNTGNAPVLFKTETWHQYDDHIARDATGADIPVSGTRYSGITPMATYRLAPGEYCEVLGHGIAIGSGEYTEERSTGSVGAVIEAKEGDTVFLSHRVDVETGGWTRPDDPKDPAELWKATIAERVANEAPMPASAADREQLIRRVTLDMFGVEPTAEEIAAFIADDAPDGLARLTARLQARPHLEPWAGQLPTGETTFRVVSADPDAATAPRSANSPGRYVLGDHVHLLVSQRTEGGRRTNKAVIAFLSPDPKIASPHEPYEIALPKGLAGYGIVWERGVGELWVAQAGLVRRYNFSNPGQVREMKIEPGGILNIPAHLHEALKEVFDLAGGPELPPDPNAAPASPAPADASQRIDWSEFPSYDELANPFDPQQAVRLASAPERSKQDTRRLMFLILQGAAEKSPELRPLLHDEELKRSDDAFHSLALALAAYDYSVNGNEKALQVILDELAREPIGSDAQAAVPLGFIDEWDLSIAAHEKHFARTDGAGGLAYALFWEQRRHLYPERYARFLSGRLAAAKLDAGSLRGTWTGERDGVRMELRIGGAISWEVRQGDEVIKAQLTTRPWPNGRAISLMAPREKEGRVPCGRLWRSDDGTLRIDVWPDVSESTPYPRVSDIVLDRVSGEQPEGGAQLEPATERKLQWGEPSNGLRMALAWPPTLGAPALGQAPEFWLVVQNVSEGEVRLTANDTAPNPRRLMMRDNGRPLQAIRDPVRAPGDWLLQPGEVAFLRLFQSDSEWKDGKTISSAIEQDIRNVPRYSMTAEMTIEQAPAGAWTGKLVTGQTRGSADVTQSAAPGSSSLHPITDGIFSAHVLRGVGQEPVVILTDRVLTASPDSTSREGSVTMDVSTSAKTETIRYSWQDDAPGFLDLKVGGFPASRFDLSRGRVFLVHFEKLEFSAHVFQVPAGVDVPAITSPEALTEAAAVVTAWHAASDDLALWECSRVLVPGSEYRTGQPLDASAQEIVWGEANEVGLRLGLGGLVPGTSFPVGQNLPVKQYIRNDGMEALQFSPTQVFNEGVGGELVLTADGRRFPHQKGYRWQMFFDRVRLAPGHYIALGSGPLGTTMPEKDGSSPGGMGMMAHGFTVLPGEYTLRLTHGIGQFLGRPVNMHFGDPRGAPGLGEWTGVLKSAAVPVRLMDEQVRTARAGDSEEFGRYMIAFEKGVLELRHYNGYPNMSSQQGGRWESESRDWKVPAPDGEYVAAWAVGGRGLWVKDATGITHLIVKENLTVAGKWPLDQVSGELGGMPAGVRAFLQLPPVAASQSSDF